MTESHFAIISDWMKNGNINEFVKANPSAQRLGLVRFFYLTPQLRPPLIEPKNPPSWKMSPRG